MSWVTQWVVSGKSKVMSSLTAMSFEVFYNSLRNQTFTFRRFMFPFEVLSAEPNAYKSQTANAVEQSQTWSSRWLSSLSVWPCSEAPSVKFKKRSFWTFWADAVILRPTPVMWLAMSSVACACHIATLRTLRKNLPTARMERLAACWPDETPNRNSATACRQFAFKFNFLSFNR